MKSFLTLIGLFAAVVPAFAAAKVEESPKPDFTKGDTLAKGGPHDWTLGPTGARGWIYTANGHSAEARQILVTSVAKDSPAAAVLSTGDVILGVDGKNFSGDARIQFAGAIVSDPASNTSCATAHTPKPSCRNCAKSVRNLSRQRARR